MADSWTWGTVTAVSPLRVRLDGDTTALTVTPDPLTAGLVAGDRVYCQIRGHRLTVWGRGPQWRSWTPAMSGSTTNPSFGSTAIVQAAYRVFAGVCDWRVMMGADGTGISAGSGSYTITLPVAAVGSYSIVGSGWIYGPAGFKPFIADASGSTARMIRTDTGGFVDHTVGPTGAGSTFSIAGSYQVA